MNDNQLMCICAKCSKEFKLTSDSEVQRDSTYVKIEACDSAGIYSIHVDCPHCGHVHNLYN